MNKIINRISFFTILGGFIMVLLSMFNGAVSLINNPSFIHPLGYVFFGFCVVFSGVILAISRITWVNLKKDGIF